MKSTYWDALGEYLEGVNENDTKTEKWNGKVYFNYNLQNNISSYPTPLLGDKYTFFFGM